MNQLTTAVVKVAKEAGFFLKEQRKFFRPEEVVEKENYDYVSYVDKEAEMLIVRRLAELLPAAGFITEEGQGEFHNEEYCWVIDPLDGTTNYIHDYAPYCVSIALQRGKETQIGVVYEVCRDECFWAWKAGGAYLNGRKIETSPTEEISKAFIGLGLPYNSVKYAPVLNKLIPQFYGHTMGIRISGSAAVNLCYVAAGRYDFWFEAFIKLWDFAAGALIVSEAKGVVSGLDGRPDFSASHHVLASSNPVLHKQVLNLLADCIENVL
ncbi:MAG: inositol monophosphatase [Dysgonamonadaceae bacterium]|jgi:myo-inositol-1(or 4)-monophosphatase|nr:inositol monophosphatase [Dysgonamonadaceae bacterium]